MFHPGNGSPLTSMYLFELKDEKKKLSPLIIQFNFINRIIFWHYPLEDEKDFEVFPTINFPFHEKKTDVSMTGYSVEDEKTEWGGKENLSFKYNQIDSLDKIFDALKQIKFDGVVSIELFNPEYWKWDAEKTIKVAKEKTEKILRKYGVFK